jgi:ribonuclease HI
MKMEAPRSQKKVQRLTGCMAALSRFISRLGEKGLPFYKLLKKVDKFQWTSEAQEALDALKKFLTTPPVLKPPRRATSTQPAEDLLLYISCTTHVVSTALVVERAEEGHTYPVQHPVYFISEVLGPSKKKYPQVQKLLYAVLLTARKLRHYFDDHKVIVVTGFPIGDILHNKEAIGRIAKWACELGSHDIEFRPRTAIKTQALVDFVSEWTEQQVPDNPETAEVWRMYFDGSLKLQGAGAGILFAAPGGEHLKYALQLLFPASNNAAEYEALIHGLNIAISLGIKRLMVYGDSLVVISQINKAAGTGTAALSWAAPPRPASSSRAEVKEAASARGAYAEDALRVAAIYSWVEWTRRNTNMLRSGPRRCPKSASMGMGPATTRDCDRPSISARGHGIWPLADYDQHNCHTRNFRE